MMEPNSTTNNQQPASNSPQTKLVSIIDSLLFVSDHPITQGEFEEILTEFSKTQIADALAELETLRSNEISGIQLSKIDNGYQYRTIKDNAEWIIRFNKAKPQRLSRASLETLSIVAYRQPMTRPEVDDIRGVDSSGVLKVLLERNMVKILGKKDEVGHPLLYGTTKEFLSFFNLNNLGDLPPLKEYTELGQESLAKLQQLFPEGMNVEQNIEAQNILPLDEAPTEETL
jgi:segregation and condensation protein B